LNVRFVSASAAEVLHPAVGLPAGPQQRSVANRLRESVAIGDVTDLQALAQELVAGDAQAAALGHRIARLLSDFDFDGLRDLAASLAVDAGEPA
jgi:hypothetical protein